MQIQISRLKNRKKFGTELKVKPAQVHYIYIYIYIYINICIYIRIYYYI